MVTRYADREVTTKENMFNGAGALTNRVIASQATMYDKNRLFNHCYLAKGSEVGWHVHKGDGEVYYILKGEGEYNDNGTVTTVGPGDVCWTPDGEGHSLMCTSEEPLEFIALVVYSK